MLASIISNIIPAPQLRAYRPKRNSDNKTIYIYNNNIYIYNNDNNAFAVLPLIVYTTLAAPPATYSTASAVAGGAIILNVYNNNIIYINIPREVYYSNRIILFSNNYII